jgi:hypothetical protein
MHGAMYVNRDVVSGMWRHVQSLAVLLFSQNYCWAALCSQRRQNITKICGGFCFTNDYDRKNESDEEEENEKNIRERIIKKSLQTRSSNGYLRKRASARHEEEK